MIKKIDAKGKSVLVIGDTHIPYSHKDYIKFLAKIKKLYEPEIIVHAGDELDYHAISFHKSDSSLMTADQELDNSIIELQEGLHRLFPKMELLESNHGSLITRRLKVEGIPIRTLKPLKELYEVPLWNWHNELILQTMLGPIYLCHGKSSAYGKTCKEKGMSSISGHHHGKFEITWHSSGDKPRFNAFTGCLVDAESMAMAYGRNNLQQPILGSIYIDQSGIPHLMHMQLGEDGDWNGII